MATPLLEERIDPTDDVAVFLAADCIAIVVGGTQGDTVEIRPTSHEDAKRLSMALRRAQRRVEAIGVALAQAAG